MDQTNKPAWLEIAEQELGQAEIAGETDNPRILQYFKATSFIALHDEVPWCAAFVCWCLEQAGITSSKSAQAIKYLDWGTEISEPVLGCLVVLRRTADPTKGHVGFVLDASELRLVVLGGNQSNKVSAAVFDRKDVLSFRWPSLREMKD